jgi:uncharacterized protein (TIGR01777 family)
MKNKHIVIAGGSGFIGRSLVECWGKENRITVISRHPIPETDLVKYVYWDARHPGEWCKALEGCNLLVNLAGKSVNCRYTEANKQEIFDSRTITTQLLGDAIATLKQPPEVWVNAASATTYRHAEDRPMDEYTGEMENDFSVQVCKKWEKTFNDITLPYTRKIVLRMGIALGWQKGGVMHPFLNLVKFGLGGYQGNGKQRFTWVHIEDVAGMITWLYDNKTLSGVFNCTAPAPVLNKDFMRTLRTATGHIFGLPAPEFMLKIGAAIIGTETELLLKSRWVLPTRAKEEGFKFQFPHLPGAISNIISHLPRSAYHLF